MEELNLKAKEIMAFVPSGSDFELAIEFYKDLGFEVDWKSEELAIIKLGSCRFFLQKFENKELQANFMMNLDVENVEDWWAKIESLKLKEKYKGILVKAPEVYPWGKKEILITDPAGVLWHIAIRV